MTAFEEVMTAEAAAEKSIKEAKEATITALTAAEVDRKTRLETLEAELEKIAAAETTKEQARVAGLVAQIESDAMSQVAAVRQRFTAKKTELTALFKQRFQ